MGEDIGRDYGFVEEEDCSNGEVNSLSHIFADGVGYKGGAKEGSGAWNSSVTANVVVTKSTESSRLTRQSVRLVPVTHLMLPYSPSRRRHSSNKSQQEVERMMAIHCHVEVNHYNLPKPLLLPWYISA
jgi:hypothetical protein